VSTLSKATRLAIAALALATGLALLWPLQAVTVRPARGGRLMWAVPAGPGARATLRWTHTVTRWSVAETYAIEPDGRLRLAEMDFDQFGPNLPSAPEGATTWDIRPDGIHVTGYTDRFSQLNLAVGPFDHWLAEGARELDLVKAIGSEQLIRIRVEREPRIFIILSEVWQWRNSNSRS
jgi:hypothetical protein